MISDTPFFDVLMGSDDWLRAEQLTGKIWGGLTAIALTIGALGVKMRVMTEGRGYDRDVSLLLSDAMRIMQKDQEILALVSVKENENVIGIYRRDGQMMTEWEAKTKFGMHLAPDMTHGDMDVRPYGNAWFFFGQKNPEET